MDLNTIGKIAHENSAAHGFWDGTERNEDGTVRMSVTEHLAKHALFSSEVAECTEEVRKPNFDPRATYLSEKGKPEGLPAELADIIIRVTEYAHALGINIQQAVIDKHEYNKTRPYKHGKTA